jgi:methylenetetrahydrofolate reductase (NADPH)
MSARVAYPDGHPDRPSDQSRNEELDHLKAKVDAGADFIVTQLFYDVDHFIQWLVKVRQKGGLCTNDIYHPGLISVGIRVPVIPGIMPIQTYASFGRLVKLCGSKVPPEVMSALESIQVSL